MGCRRDRDPCYCPDLLTNIYSTSSRSRPRRHLGSIDIRPESAFHWHPSSFLEQEEDKEMRIYCTYAMACLKILKVLGYTHAVTLD